MADQNQKIPYLLNQNTGKVSETDLIIIISLSAIHILVSLIMLFKSIIQKETLSIFVWIVSVIVCAIILGFAIHYYNGIKQLNDLSLSADDAKKALDDAGKVAGDLVNQFKQ